MTYSVKKYWNYSRAQYRLLSNKCQKRNMIWNFLLFLSANTILFQNLYYCEEYKLNLYSFS